MLGDAEIHILSSPPDSVTIQGKNLVQQFQQELLGLLEKRNDLMIEVVSEVQHFVCSLICFLKRTVEMELNAAFQHLSYPEFWSRQEHIGPAISDAGLAFLFL